MSILRMRTPATAAKSPRFVLRWNNGLWKVFDAVTYIDHSTWGLKRDAEEERDRLNGVKKVQRGSRPSVRWEHKPTEFHPD